MLTTAQGSGTGWRRWGPPFGRCSPRVDATGRSGSLGPTELQFILLEPWEIRLLAHQKKLQVVNPYIPGMQQQARGATTPSTPNLFKP